MTWWDSAPALALALLLLLGPGVAVGGLLGLRGPLLVAAAGPFSVSVLATSAVWTQPAGLRWSLPAVAAGAVPWLVAALVVGRALARREHPAPRPGPGARWWAAAGGLGLALLLPSVAFMIGRPDNIAQLHDNVFHLSAVRYVLESGNGSPFTLGHLGTDTAPAFYPAAWHDVVSLVARYAGVPIPVAVNAVTLVEISAIWLPGWLLLAHLTCGGGRLVLLLAGAFSVAFSTFPFLLFGYGVVYPWLLALCLLPFVLSAVILLAGPGTWPPSRWVVLATAVPGLGLAHPSMVPVAALFAAPAVVRGHLLRRRETRSPAARRRLSGWLLGYPVLLVVLWTVLRPPRVSNWNDIGGPTTALYGIALQAPVGEPTPWLLVGLVFAGLVALTRVQGRMWLFGLYTLTAAVFVATQLRPLPDLRWWLSGVWYEDPFRAASLVPVGVMPLVVLGAAYLVRQARAAVLARRGPGAARGAGALAFAALAAAAVASPAVREARDDGRLAYTYSSTSPLLTVQERALLRRLPARVPEGGMVAGNPMTGAALGYALEGVPAVEPAAGLRRGRDGALVMNRLNRLASDPAVCPAVRRLNVRYAVDFGSRGVDSGRLTPVPGLTGLAAAPGFRLVDSAGRARLYEVTGC